MTAPSHTIDLTHPVEIGGKILSSIAIRAPTDADFAAIYRLNSSAEAKSIKFVARLTGHDWRALDRIEEVNEGFLARVDELITPPSTEA